MQCELVNQYFQWVVRSRFKEALGHIKGIPEILEQHANHEISYWEKERAACAFFEQHLQKLRVSERQVFERRVVGEALNWFNYFISGLNITYRCTFEGLQSTLN